MKKQKAIELLRSIDLGSGVAETDKLLENARVETSVFNDLLADRVDLVPGTKGSGKTALYRIFVDFLPTLLLTERKVVIAHGVRQRQDTIFLAHKDQFDKLTEADFVDFWCIYLISLAHEQFIRSDQYKELVTNCQSEIDDFREKYRNTGIPELKKKLSLIDILAWTLEVVRKLKPHLAWTPPGDAGQFELGFGGSPASPTKSKFSDPLMPLQIDALASSLDALMTKADLSLWLMIDQLDELFARRSKTERQALRGLLQTLRLFGTERIRVKVFLRDDMLEEIVVGEGFTALSHVTARKSDVLRWSEEQILTLVIRRIFAQKALVEFFEVDENLLKTSVDYQRELFYKIFSDTVHRPPNQSATLRWIYNHTKDGRGVVTPRDVINLFERAFQHQRDIWQRDPEGETDRLVTGPSISYGLDQLSNEKRTIYLEAEFPHKWPEIQKLVGGGTTYSEKAMKRLYGKNYLQSIEDLLSLGIVENIMRKGERCFKVPFLYRRGLDCTQRFVSK